MAFSIIVFTGDIFSISLDEKYENRICCAGFSTSNKIRKVLPETGLRYPSSVLWLGCTRLRRFITTPRYSLGSPYFPLQNCVQEYLSTGAIADVRAHLSVSCALLNKNFGLNIQRGETRTHCEGKNKEIMNDNFF